MDKMVINNIICPNCQSGIFTLLPFDSDANDIREGIITCDECGIWYRIEGGVLDLLTLTLRRQDLYANFAKKYNLVPSVSEPVNVNQQKLGQIQFFKGDVPDYERNVAMSTHYRARVALTFERWFNQNYKSITAPILELGCGTGTETIKIADKHISAICIDISEEMIRTAKSKIDKLENHANINFITGDAECPPVKDNMFGACVMCGTLHHLSSPQTAIKNLSSKLVDGGLFFSFDPHDSCIRFLFDFLIRVWKLYEDQANDNPLFNANDLSAWLTDAGIHNTISYSTYLPPHAFLFFDDATSLTVLKITDSIMNKIPLMYKFSGLIMAEGVKCNLPEKMR